MSTLNSNIGINDPQKNTIDKEIDVQINEELTSENLSYNEEEDSFELDVVSEDKDYDHPDPYKTSVKNGSDFDSDFDEANLTVGDEYKRVNDANSEVASIGDEFGMHIDEGSIVQLDPLDEELSHTPEDDRDDLDEEGYPINDTKNL